VPLSALRQLVLLSTGGMRTTELTSPQRNLLEKTGKFWAEDDDQLNDKSSTAPNGGLANIQDDEDDERLTPAEQARRNQAKIAEISRAKALAKEARDAERREEEEELRQRLAEQKFGNAAGAFGHFNDSGHTADHHDITATQVLDDNGNVSSGVAAHHGSEQKYGPTPSVTPHHGHARSASHHGTFDLGGQLGRVQQQMIDAGVDQDSVTDFVDHLKVRWSLLVLILSPCVWRFDGVN
jgi:hypothetical protein